MTAPSQTIDTAGHTQARRAAVAAGTPLDWISHSLRHLERWVAWSIALYTAWLAVFALPILLVDLALGAVLATRSGTMGQLGRGMLVGLIAVPMTLLIFLPGLLLVQEFGLV